MGNESSEEESDDRYEWCYICNEETGTLVVLFVSNYTGHSTRHCNKIEKIKSEYFQQQQRYKLANPKPKLKSISGFVSFFKKLSRTKCIFKLTETKEKLFYYFRDDNYDVKKMNVFDQGVQVLVYPTKNNYYLVKSIPCMYDLGKLLV